MKLYVPAYYKEFKCIADRCRHSCCIGWEIDIDPETVKKYRSLKSGYGKSISESIEVEGEVPHFRLCNGDRCPHLDAHGLCRIISELGEDCLCHICRSHPRFFNDTLRGREAGLGMACEESARIILSSDSYAEMVTTEEFSPDEWERPASSDIDATFHRERIYSFLSENDVPYTDRLRRIYGEYGVSPNILTDKDFRELIGSLEYLEEAHREQFLHYSSDISTPKELEKPLRRALAYFVYRHCSVAETEADLRASLGFALFCERLLCSVARQTDALEPESFTELARSVSEELEYSEDNTQSIRFEFYM